MMIGWTKSDLLKLKDKYKNLYKKEEDEQEQVKHLATLASIDAVLDYYRIQLRKFFDKDRPDIIAKEDLIFLRDYGFYAPYIRNFATFSDHIEDEHLRIKRMKNPAMNLIDEMKDFYSLIGGVYKKQFFNLIKGNKLRLKFIDEEKMETGATLPILNTEYIYMYVGRIDNFQDYVTMAHECGHGISCIMNPEGIFNYDRFLFSEVISIFFETIANDEISSKLNIPNDGKAIKIESYNAYLHASKLICAKIDMLSSLNCQGLRNPKVMKSFLERYHALDENDIKVLMNKGIPNISQYVISYLTAIELYLIYKEDKEKALDLLTQMVMKEECDPRKYLNFVVSLGIEPGKNISKYEEMLSIEREEIKKNTK